MTKFTFGDIVLLNFPFTDSKRKKRRPVLVLNDFNDGDILVCRITSRIYKTSQDIIVPKWETAGLKLPSVIRVHKLATLDKTMVENILGKIDEKTKQQIQQLLSVITE